MLNRCLVSPRYIRRLQFEDSGNLLTLNRTGRPAAFDDGCYPITIQSRFLYEVVQRLAMFVTKLSYRLGHCPVP